MSSQSQKQAAILHIWQHLTVLIDNDLSACSYIPCGPQKLLVCSLLNEDIVRWISSQLHILGIELTDSVQHLFQEISMSLHPKHPYTLQW